MTRTTRRSRLRWIVPALAALIAACGDDGNGHSQQSTPTPSSTPTATTAPPATVTPTRPAGALNGLVVIDPSFPTTSGDGGARPPAEWAAHPDSKSFDRSLAYADWTVAERPEIHGTTGADGQFVLGDLPPGNYTLIVTRTLDGNLASMKVPVVVGPSGATALVAEVAWGQVRSSSTYNDGTVTVVDVRGPYGNWLISRDGQVAELGDPTRTLTDADGDGRFDVAPCLTDAWTCDADLRCTGDRVCQCVAACPYCDSCMLPGVCVPPGTPPPYACAPDGSCARPGDRCTCVASCPECDDCQQQVCVAGCDPVELTAVRIVAGPAQLVVGQRTSLSAVADLSDGSQVDVTHLASWQSSQPAVARIDSWGTLTGNAIGSAAITATVGTLVSPPWTIEVVARPALRRIDIQNASCWERVAYPGWGLPSGVVDPTADILPPIPGCTQVVEIGRSIRFRAVGEFANGSYEDITEQVLWRVDPSALGDVTSGVFTAREAGTAALTASLDGITSAATEIRIVAQATVVDLSIYADGGVIAYAGSGPGRDGIAAPCVFDAPPPPGVCCCAPALADGSIPPCDCGYTIPVLRGDTVRFHATARYDTGDYRDVTDQVTWRSTNPAAATIAADGVLTAVDAGDASIDATLGNSASNKVGVHVVTEATLQSMYIQLEGFDRVVAKGEQRFFTATGNYDVGFGREVTKLATWRSNSEAVGGFDTPGTFTARAPGMVKVWAELDGVRSEAVALEVYETSDVTYCDPATINRAVWSDEFNRVTLESDCATYQQPGVVTLRYTVTEHQPHGGIFDPCLDLYVYQGDTRVRTIREEGCGEPFLPGAAPGRDEAALKYQLRAFWDLKGENGQPVPPGVYTVFGRFYLYYDPVVRIDVAVLAADGTLPTPTPTPTPAPVCTPPACAPDGVLSCPGKCPGGCGVVCIPGGRLPTLQVGSARVAPGGTAQFAVSLQTAGQPIAGLQNDLLFDPVVGVPAAANGRPACVVGADIDKNATAFVFLPSDCKPGVDCKGMRALVVATDNADPLADGAVLYTCRVTASPETRTGRYPLTVSYPVASDPKGERIPITSTDGVIEVGTGDGETPPPDATTLPGPEPTPLPEGVCYHGSDYCVGVGRPTTQGACCALEVLSLSPLPFSWCPKSQIDAVTGACLACADNPCGKTPDSATRL